MFFIDLIIEGEHNIKLLLFVYRNDNGIVDISSMVLAVPVLKLWQNYFSTFSTEFNKKFNLRT